MERISIDGRIVPTINGGHGSGNFGHSGRPGKVGGSGTGKGAKTDYDAESVSERTILRDYGEYPYIDKEHEMLCDIADTLYNANLGPEDMKAEYKELYDKYGKEFFDKVLKDMSAIDSQIQEGSRDPHFAELEESYLDRVNSDRRTKDAYSGKPILEKIDDFIDLGDDTNPPTDSDRDAARQYGIEGDSALKEAKTQREYWETAKTILETMPKADKFQLALSKYAGSDMFSVLQSPKEFKQFEEWAAKTYFTKDELEKLEKSSEYDKLMRDIADM